MQTLRMARDEAFLTQDELAERAKVSRVTIANIELGNYRPLAKTARKIAAALGVAPGEIDWPKAAPITHTATAD